MFGQLDYRKVARDSVSEVVISIRSNRGDKGETIGGFRDLFCSHHQYYY